MLSSWAGPAAPRATHQAMATLRTSRAAWVEAGLAALAAGGPDAVRVESLADSLGVTKGGFYGQFANRQELLTEMLDTWATSVVDTVIEEVERGGGDARARLAHLFSIARARGEGLLKIELAIRDWARRDELAATRLHQVDSRRMQYMRSLFSGLTGDASDVEARCLLVFSLFVGSNFVAADHPGKSREEVIDAALELLLR
jgi:AcrR family transcriptional regulator